MRTIFQVLEHQLLDMQHTALVAEILVNLSTESSNLKYIQGYYKDVFCRFAAQSVQHLRLQLEQIERLKAQKKPPSAYAEVLKCLTYDFSTKIRGQNHIYRWLQVIKRIF